MVAKTTEVGIAKREVEQVVGTLAAIGDLIREIGEVPSGHLYARLCGTMNLETYTRLIEILKAAQLVSESAHLLTWIGPAATPKGGSH